MCPPLPATQFSQDPPQLAAAFWLCAVPAPRFAALRIVAPTPWYRCIPSLMPRWSAYCGLTIPLFLELPRRCELLVLTPPPNFAANFFLISNVCSGVSDGFVIRELNSKKVLNFVLFTVFDLPASAGSLRQPGMHAFVKAVRINVNRGVPR